MCVVHTAVGVFCADGRLEFWEGKVDGYEEALRRSPLFVLMSVGWVGGCRSVISAAVCFFPEFVSSTYFFVVEATYTRAARRSTSKQPPYYCCAYIGDHVAHHNRLHYGGINPTAALAEHMISIVNELSTSEHT